MATFLIRLLRGLGWIALICSAGVVVCVTAWQVVRGTIEGQSLWPMPAIWQSLVRTLLISAVATLFSFLLGLPAAFALLHARRRWQHLTMRTLTLIPLLTMPSIYAYAWLIIGTSQHWLL